MKNFFNQVAQFFDTIGRARAASHLANMGHHEAAKRLMTRD